MDDAAERMSALKKAYAEIILNMAKESAARILASEGKASRFKQDLAASKEGAILTLLRVKSIMEAKVIEKEKVSLDQAKRIQDLEGQLNESKNIVRSLETELNRVKDEMLYMKSNPEALDKQTALSRLAIYEDPDEDSNIRSDSVPCSPNSRPLHLPALDKKNLTNQSTSDGCCCAISKNCVHPKPSEYMSPENKCSSSPDFASIIARNKDPELYRAGRTQRIHALEQNNLTGKLSARHSDDQFSKAASFSFEIDKSVVHKDKQNESNIMLSDGLTIEDEGGHIVNLSCSRASRRRRKRRRNVRLANFSIFDPKYSKFLGNSNECSQRDTADTSPLVGEDDIPGILRCQNKDWLSNSGVKSRETGLNVENAGHKELNESSQSPCSTGRNFQNSVAENLLDMGTAVPLTPKTGKLGITEGLHEANSSLVNSYSEGGKNSESNESHNRAHEVIIRYTRRKRMRGSSSGNENIVPEKKIKRGKIEDGDLEGDEKPSLERESSCDSRRIAQVARQLISLSQRKWS